jgi:hypothetical protein
MNLMAENRFRAHVNTRERVVLILGARSRAGGNHKKAINLDSPNIKLHALLRQLNLLLFAYSELIEFMAASRDVSAAHNARIAHAGKRRGDMFILQICLGA